MVRRKKLAQDYIPSALVDFNVFFRNLSQYAVQKTQGCPPSWTHIIQAAATKRKKADRLVLFKFFTLIIALLALGACESPLKDSGTDPNEAPLFNSVAEIGPTSPPRPAETLPRIPSRWWSALTWRTTETAGSTSVSRYTAQASMWR
jgi:hypothetical protein